MRRVLVPKILTNMSAYISPTYKAWSMARVSYVILETNNLNWVKN